MLFGHSVLGWLMAVIAAVLVFLLLRWLLAPLLAAIGLAVPDIIILLFCVLVALDVLLGGPRYIR